MVFSVKVPGNSTPKTRAVSSNEANVIKQIAVLLFKDGKYTHHPIYSNSISDGEDGKKTFTIRVPEGTFNMVSLANANASLKEALSGISVGTAKDDLLKSLTVTNEEKWNLDPQKDNYKPIPMWGEIPTVTVNSNTENIEASLLRMVSKIDVSLTTKAQKDFELTSVYVYNYNSMGQIIPSADALNESKTEVSKPTVLGNQTKGPLQYDKDAITKDLNTHKGSSCINEIYTFEAAAGTANDLSKNTCLVIGGRYQNDTKDTYYRIDFANTADGAITYLPLLRNNQYRVDVQSISGPGLPTTEQAFNSRPVNIKASILNWSDGRFTEFDVNGQYFVGVSQGKYTFSKEERGDKSSDNILSILTNHPDGWKIEITDKDGKITNYSWLECSSTKGVANKAADVRLKLGKNDSERPRTAYVHVKAGRLDYIVEVTQLNTFQKGIIQREANSYMMTTSDHIGILIPVSRANVIGTQLSATDKFTSNLVWTDNRNGVNADSNIEMIKTVGIGNKGYVLVFPGKAEGNSVVAIKKADKVLWSWHIWVIETMPQPSQKGNFMDRNLGALGANVSKNEKCRGLFYQWGRKDPFPTKQYLGLTPLYNSEGTRISNNEVNVSSGTGSVSYAVEHPETFINGSSTQNGDWLYTSDPTLWKADSEKTVYDPCPYGWRIPNSSLDWNISDGAAPWTNFGDPKGLFNSDLGGFYPISGFLKGIVDGQQDSLWFYYWACKTSDKESEILAFNSGNPTRKPTDGHMSRSNGATVRCKKE